MEERRYNNISNNFCIMRRGNDKKDSGQKKRRGSPVRILVVDQDPVLAPYLKDSLERNIIALGYQPIITSLPVANILFATRGRLLGMLTVNNINTLVESVDGVAITGFSESYGRGEERDVAFERIYNGAVRGGKGIIGICGAHQQVAMLKGNELVEREEQLTGWNRLRLEEPAFVKGAEGIFRGYEGEFRSRKMVFPCFNRMFVPNNPEGMVQLARLAVDHAKYSGMAMDSSDRVVTIQPHPEMLERDVFEYAQRRLAAQTDPEIAGGLAVSQRALPQVAARGEKLGDTPRHAEASHLSAMRRQASDDIDDRVNEIFMRQMCRWAYGLS